MAQIHETTLAAGTNAPQNGTDAVPFSEGRWSGQRASFVSVAEHLVLRLARRCVDFIAGMVLFAPIVVVPPLLSARLS